MTGEKALTPYQRVMADQKARTASGYLPGKDAWDVLSPEEQKKRFNAFRPLYKKYTGEDYPFDIEGQPLQAPAPQGQEGGSTPATPGAVTPSSLGWNPNAPRQPAPAAGATPGRRSWRPARAPDGSMWMIDPATGEKMPIEQR